ncbi:MAG: D-alanine--D-alanine ligase [Halieaceae bacterium]|nr:D-alanine--D-alanine ligase [Halieaceae bacterium]
MTLRIPEGMRVAVMSGGSSAEREISLQSGQTVLQGLRAGGVDALSVDPAEPGWVGALQDVGLVFIALHGPGGEDGSMQGALQALGLPYTGSGVLGSALAMDKQRSKQLWRGIGLATPEFTRLHAQTDWQEVVAQYGAVFVKPAREGSSIGMSRADSAQALRAAFELASAYPGDVLAEQFVDGPEYTVGVLGGRALPSIRLETSNEFYDYEAKYLSEDTGYHCPSGLSNQDEAEISALSLRAFHTLGCSVWGRVDVMRDSSGRFQVLEVNTVPGMTSHSLVPMAAAQGGMSVPDLLQSIGGLSLREKR